MYFHQYLVLRRTSHLKCNGQIHMGILSSKRERHQIADLIKFFSRHKLVVQIIPCTSTHHGSKIPCSKLLWLSTKYNGRKFTPNNDLAYLYYLLEMTFVCDLCSVMLSSGWSVCYSFFFYSSSYSSKYEFKVTITLRNGCSEMISRRLLIGLL